MKLNLIRLYLFRSDLARFHALFNKFFRLDSIQSLKVLRQTFLTPLGFNRLRGDLALFDDFRLIVQLCCSMSLFAFSISSHLGDLPFGAS